MPYKVKCPHNEPTYAKNEERVNGREKKNERKIE